MIKHTLVGLWAAAFAWLACAALASAPAGLSAKSTSPKPLSDPHGAWVLRLAYSDEFNQHGLDESKWHLELPRWGKWNWASHNVTVRGGNLRLRMDYDKNSRHGTDIYYDSGIVQSARPPILYGYFEAKIRGSSRFPGTCPAFWAYHANKTDWAEIDFIELEQNSDKLTADFSAMIWRSPQITKPILIIHHVKLKSDPARDFHVYGMLWSSDSLKWYLDGALVAETPNLYWHAPLDLTLSMGLRAPLRMRPSGRGFPTEMRVDYVRVWQ